MAKTNKTALFQLSNPFSTGGGGTNFEHRVQASFLLGLLIKGFAPVLNQPIQRVSFQTKIHGFELDDVMVVAKGALGDSKMLCQIKHKPTFTLGNQETEDVIRAAWSDFNNTEFNKGLDKLVVITGFISFSTIEALRSIHQLATSCMTATDFIDKISRANFTSNKTRQKYNEIKSMINLVNGSTVSDDNIWDFFKVFVLLVYDLDYQNSINAVLIESLIKSNCKEDPKDIWARLCYYASQCDQSAADITLNNFDCEIMEKFGISLFQAEEAVDITPSSFLAKLALVGEWEDSNIDDCIVVEKLIGEKYEQIRTTLQNQLAQDVNYIKWSGERWKIIDPENIARACNNYYYDDTISFIFDTACSMLQEKDKRLDNKQGILFAGRAFDYSLALRKNILIGMNILINKIELPNCSKEKTNYTRNMFIKNLFDNCTWERWASIGDLLCLIAEIAPNAYLNSMEKYLKNKAEDVRILLPQRDGSLWERDNLCPILWSIERLAWDDCYLLSCIRCLCELNMLQHDHGNTGNTPKNSIVRILLPWHHCTLASTETRKSAISLMLREYLSTEWESIKALMPNETTFSVLTSQPEYILHVPENADLSSDYDEMSIYIFQQAVFFAADDVGKLSDMVKYVDFYYSNLGVQFLESIETNYANWSAEDRFSIWNKLEDCKYKILSRNGGKGPKSEAFSVLCRVIEALTPSNMVYKVKRLFVAKYDDFSIKEDNHVSKNQAKAQAQLAGLKEVWKSHGLDGVLQLTEGTSKDAVIFERFGSVLDIDDFEQVLSYCYSSNNIFLIKAVTRSFIICKGVKTFLSIDWSHYSLDFVADILADQQLTGNLLEVVNVLLKENEQLYWKKASVPTYFEGVDYDIETVISHLIKENRYAAIISMIGWADKKMPVRIDVLYDILLKAASTENKQDRLDGFDVTNLIKYLQQKDSPDINKLAIIEFQYLPWLNEYSAVQPRALNTLIANDPEAFCALMAKMYKGSDDKKTEKLPEELENRLFDILFKFKIVPGVDWSGCFHRNVFDSWINKVISWGRQSGRDTVVQHTIGSGLSYSINENGEMNQAIVEVLDKREYDAIREGFKIGIHNQRGVHTVDPEGKEEKRLNEKYKRIAINLEQLGYSRIAQTVHEIADDYLKQIDWNKKHEQD